jgi:hypothetical protein
VVFAPHTWEREEGVVVVVKEETNRWVPPANSNEFQISFKLGLL